MSEHSFNTELPIIDPNVVLFNVPAEYYKASQKRAAKLQTAKRALGGLAGDLLLGVGVSQERKRRNEAALSRYYKEQADTKASRLIDHPKVFENLFVALGVQLKYRSGSQLIRKDGSTEDMSTVIDAYGIGEKELVPKIFDWTFDVINGTPECNGFRSLVTFQTEKSPTAIAYNDPRYEITGMQAVNIETGQSFGPDDYPNPSVAQIHFYSLAERLFGKLESGLSMHEPPLTSIGGFN